MIPIIQSNHIGDLIKEPSLNEGTRVLAGGCFDLLHPGHLSFLKKAKEQGDLLFLLLESDDMIKKSKGNNRPHQDQQIRAENLAQTQIVDYVILLPEEMDNNEYDKLVSLIKPAIIATTKGDPYRYHKERQALLVGGKVVDVIDRISNFSTSQSTNKTL